MVTVIVPYRDREVHLSIFLHHKHPVLQHMGLEYRIVIAEQVI